MNDPMDPIDPPPIGARVRIGGGDGCGVLGTVSAIRVPLFSAWPTACLRVVVACDDGVTRDIRPWQALPPVVDRLPRTVPTAPAAGGRLLRGRSL